MKTLIKAFIIAALFQTTAYAQESKPAKVVEVFDIRKHDYNVSASGDTTVHLTCYLTLRDTTQPAKLHLKAAEKKGKKSLYAKTIAYDPQQKKNDAYTRKGHTLIIPLGEYKEEDDVTHELQTEDKNGKLSEVKKQETKKHGPLFKCSCRNII